MAQSRGFLNVGSCNGTPLLPIVQKRFDAIDYIINFCRHTRVAAIAIVLLLKQLLFSVKSSIKSHKLTLSWQL